MSQYPSFVFPSCPTRFSRRNQQVFTDHGCWEGVDVDLCKDSTALIAKKSRSTISTNYQMKGEQFLKPVHPFMLMDDPASLHCLIDDSSKLDEMIRLRSVSNIHMKPRKKGIYSVAAQSYFANIASDCPEITSRTFQRMMRKLDCDMSVTKAQRSRGFQRLCQMLDPMMCDTSRNCLNDILLEELQVEMKKKCCDRDFVGGSLRCHELPRSPDGRTECLIFCAQGQCLDELSVKKMEVKAEPDIEPLVPRFSVLQDVRQTLKGRILQIDTMMMQEEYDFLIATRSDYFVLISGYSDCGNSGNVSVSQSKDPMCSLSCLQMSGSSRVSSIALNPMILGECAIATEDGVVRLWNAEACSQRASTNNLEILIDERLQGSCLPSTWRQVSFAAHPRQFYFADEYKVQLFDIRRRHSSVNLFDVTSFSKSKWSEKIYCIENGRNMGSEYECLIATNCNLFLLDQRYCNEPLMQLGTNMSWPPSYAKSCTVNEVDSMETTAQHINQTTALIVANQRPQEVYLYQLNKTKQILLEDNSNTKQLPYQCSQPTRILEGFSTVKNYPNFPPKHYSYLRNRASKSIVGLDALNLNKLSMSSTGGLIVLQMNSVGDIGYQTLQMNDREDTSSRIIHSETAPAERLQNTQTQLNELKRKNYDQWIDATTTGGKNVLRRYIIPHKELKLSTQRLGQLFESCASPATSCHLCTAHRTKHINDGEISRCEMCRVDLAMSKRLRTLWQCDDDQKLLLISGRTKNYDCSEYNLDLINMGDKTGSNSLGQLLKFTWAANYEDFWESQRQESAVQQEAESQARNVRTLDLISASAPQERQMSDSHEIAKSKNDSSSSIFSGAIRNLPVDSGKRKHFADRSNTTSQGADLHDTPVSAHSFSFFSQSYSPSKRKKREKVTSSIGF